MQVPNARRRLRSSRREEVILDARRPIPKSVTDHPTVEWIECTTAHILPRDFWPGRETITREAGLAESERRLDTADELDVEFRQIADVARRATAAIRVLHSA